MTKQHNNTGELTDEQRAALRKFQRDLKTAKPVLSRTAQVAQDLHQAMVDAPVWRVTESPPPQQVSPPTQPELWTVGHAKVNYVDHIDTKE